MLTKQPRSSFLDLNIDMVEGSNVRILLGEGRGYVDADGVEVVVVYFNATTDAIFTVTGLSRGGHGQVSLATPPYKIALTLHVHYLLGASCILTLEQQRSVSRG